MAATDKDFQELFEKGKTHPYTLLTFSASWHPPSLQIVEVVKELQKEFKNVSFLTVEADKAEVTSEKYGIESIPTVVLINSKANTVVGRVEGAEAPKVVELIRKHVLVPTSSILSSSTSSSASSASSVSSTTSTTESGQTKAKRKAPEEKDELSSDISSRLKTLIATAPVMAFIKGTPTTPKCGFTKTLLQLLTKEGITFSYFDILSDETVREGLKKYSNWKTYPQLYINSELIGGIDIVNELHQQGELMPKIPKECKKEEDLNGRLKKLITSSHVMIFMKGTPNEPRCGFSSKAVGILKKAGAEFGHFDILTDDTVREGLKKYSNWPTYPQVYANGELLGGVDVISELQEAGELADALKPKSSS